MIEDLEALMNIACGRNKGNFKKYLKDTFQRLEKSKFKGNVLDEKIIEEDWNQQIKKVEQKAQEIATKANISFEEMKENWIKSAIKIVNREYRKKRFDNRNSMGKCPAKTVEDNRCKKNVPKKSKDKIRELQFEIELRQMNVKRKDHQEEKLDETKIKELMKKLVFETKPKLENKTKNRKEIDNFFTNKNGNRYVPKAKNESRGKKDILKDIICGDQKGRARFCITHLKQKLELLKDKKTTGKEWACLHEERVLSLEDDAPPSIKQKTQKVVVLVKKMLKKQGISVTNPSFKHIGIETARFDIASIAQNEGKKSKKKPTAKDYQTSKRGDKSSLRRDQDECCLFCGELLLHDCHIDHLFPKSKGGGNVILNKVVGHSICNIDKHRSKVPLNPGVLQFIKEHNLKKYKFINERLSEDSKLPQDMLASPQHTMLGAKLLQGAFIKEFNTNKDKIKKIRPKDASYLKKLWFPYMNKQKRTLRYYDYKNKTSAEEKFKNKLKSLKLDSKLFPENEKTSLIPLNNISDWLKIEGREVIGTPQEKDEGFNSFIIRNEKNKKIILSFEEINQGNNSKKPKKIEEELDKLITIDIQKIFPKDKAKLLKNPDITVKIYSDRPEKWLDFKDNKLFGKPTICEYKNGFRYVPWYNIEIVNEKKEVEYKIKVKTEIAEKKLTVAVQPKKDDGIRDFHHALDAIILASDVDWEGINRLNTDIRERDYHERKKMLEEARKENAPRFHLFKEDENRNIRAPDKSTDWYIKDKENQRKIEISKTDTEPLRKRDDKEVIQRHPLEKIKRKNIENIKSDKIKNAMIQLWKEFDNMDEDTLKNCISGNKTDKIISNTYFLTLDKNHILHPKKTRSVLCKVEGIGVKQLWQRKDKKTGGSHYFKRTVGWNEVWFISYKDSKGKDKKECVRVTSKFYWKDKSSPIYERNEIDKKLPDEYTIINKLKGGDIIKLKGEEGEWEISKLGTSSTLRNLQTDTEITVSYKKLFEQMSHNVLKKTVS